jgi:hypothetical protein
MQMMVRTHIAALQHNVRANSQEWVSGPGIGKSSTVYQGCVELARRLNEPVGLTTNMIATFQSVDIRGFMLPQKGEKRPITVFSEPPWLPTRDNMIVFAPRGHGGDVDAETYLEGAWPGPVPRVGVCFLDEWGQGEDEVKKAAAELLLNGQVGTDRLPVGWRVIAASNRMSDRAGVVRAMTFIVNRRMEVLIEPHLPTWNDWANALPPELRPHHYTVSFANKNPDLVFKTEVPPGDRPFCTPRTLVRMDQDLRALREDLDIERDRLPIDVIAREVVAGWIGAGEGAQFMSHLKYADALPEIADIVKDPMRAKLPEQRDAQMVCAFMLAHHVAEDNHEPLLRYIQRLNIDMQVLAMRTITAQTERARIVANTRIFGDWLMKHRDLLIASHS